MRNVTFARALLFVSLISAPAQKISSPPVITIARMAGLRASSFSKLAISWRISALSEFFFSGRCRRIDATASSSRYCKV